MFLELHSDDNVKIMVNIDKIDSIYQIGKITSVYVGGIIYHVEESYEQIEEAINNLTMIEYVGNRE